MVKFDIFILFLKWNFELSNFGFFSAEVSLNLKSTRLFLLLLLAFPFSCQSLLIQIAIDRVNSPISFNLRLSITEGKRRSVKLWCYKCLAPSTCSTDTSFTEPATTSISVQKISVFLSLALEFEVDSVLHIIRPSLFFWLQRKIDDIVRCFSPPSQWTEQIRVLSELTFKLAFRNKRTYSRWIRLAFGILQNARPGEFLRLFVPICTQQCECLVIIQDGCSTCPPIP